jgi:two-component system, NarL family, response regulator
VSVGRADPIVALVVEYDLAGRRVGSLLRDAGISIQAQVRGPAELTEVWGESSPDAVVVVCGSSLLAQNASVRSLTRHIGPVPILLVVPAHSPRGVRSALEAGADGVVFEGEMEVTLVASLRAVIAGQLVVPRQCRYQIDRPTLSRREKETLALVTLGMTNSEIAARLCLSESTVKSHLSSAFAKLGVRSRNEAVRLILDPREHLGADIQFFAPGANGWQRPEAGHAAGR